MSSGKTYAVFGLGRYGRTVAKELVSFGAEVIAIDSDEEIVDEAASFLPICKCADVTDPEVLKQLGIRNVDTVIICMASSLESSVMATILCREAGVGTIITKCASEIHRKIYYKVGADKVVFPEKESGIRLAKSLLNTGIIDMAELTDDVSMLEIDVKDEWAGKSLASLGLRKKYSVNIVAVRYENKIKTIIDPEMLLKKDMKLIVITDNDKIGHLI